MSSSIFPLGIRLIEKSLISGRISKSLFNFNERNFHSSNPVFLPHTPNKGKLKNPNIITKLKMDQNDRPSYEELMKLTSGEIQSLMNNIDAVMFDCDGVLWIGNKPMTNAVQTIDKLRVLGKKIFFMTNNSTKTREEFLEKFVKLGFKSSLDEIVSTSYLAALYLKEINFTKHVYVIGTTGVTRELNQFGIRTLPIGPDVISNNFTDWSHEKMHDTEIRDDVGAVVVGFDHHLSYRKILKAATYLNDPSCLFVATNTDERFPSGNKFILPGTGAIVNAVKTAAGREPVVMGKPETYPFEYVRRTHDLDPSRVLMVGDRANTDILFGRNCGLITLLVLSGVTTLDEVKEWQMSNSKEEHKLVPNYITSQIGDLLPLMEHL